MDHTSYLVWNQINEDVSIKAKWKQGAPSLILRSCHSIPDISISDLESEDTAHKPRIKIAMPIIKTALEKSLDTLLGISDIFIDTV